MNKNAVPNDPQSPFVTSGLRIGTPAVTTRGFKVTQCTELAGWICDILDHLAMPTSRPMSPVRWRPCVLISRFTAESRNWSNDYATLFGLRPLQALSQPP